MVFKKSNTQKTVIIPLLLLLSIPLLSYAQNYQEMNEREMQDMMLKMQEMQSCMQSVDETELKALERRSYEADAEIKSLCAKGKRDKAQRKAIAFGQEISESPAIKTMRKCSEIMEGIMKETPFMSKDRDYSNSHVCDN